MVRLIHQNKIFSAVAAITALAAGPVVNVMAEEANTKLQVNVAEVLTVTLTKPQTWASGDVGDFLRNKITLNVISNNPAGYTASMYTNNTNLVNQAKSTSTIPTLASSTTHGAFPANRWGYSLTDTAAGNASASYGALTTSTNPITVLTNSDADDTADVFFGAKADATKDSGTYAQTVIFSVVSGVINNNTNPVVPSNPVTPEPANNQNNGTAEYIATNNYGNSTTGATRYTTSGTSGSGTNPVSGAVSSTTTQVTSGNTTSSYASPAGVTTTSKSDSNNLLPGILAGAAAVAAISGGAFLVASRRKNDEGE